MTRDYVYVSYMGEIYRLTKRNWKRYLKDVVANEEKTMDDYGKYVCVVTRNVTDMGASEAQFELNQFDEE